MLHEAHVAGFATRRVGLVAFRALPNSFPLIALGAPKKLPAVTIPCTVITAMVLLICQCPWGTKLTTRSPGGAPAVRPLRGGRRAEVIDAVEQASPAHAVTGSDV
jgi:hypothetical protein